MTGSRFGIDCKHARYIILYLQRWKIAQCNALDIRMYLYKLYSFIFIHPEYLPILGQWFLVRLKFTISGMIPSNLVKFFMKK